MKLHLSLLVAFIAGSLFNAQAWDFTPKEANTFVDGPRPCHYSLFNGQRKVNLRVDPRTATTGNAAAADFTFTDLSYATLRLSQSPLQVKRPPFEKNLPLYQEAAQKKLPDGATNIVLESQSLNPFPINDWTSYQFVFTYAYFGRAIRTSLTFLNYNAKEQWLIAISSTPGDFQKTTGRAGSIINSLNETDSQFKLEDAPN